MGKRYDLKQRVFLTSDPTGSLRIQTVESRYANGRRKGSLKSGPAPVRQGWQWKQNKGECKRNDVWSHGGDPVNDLLMICFGLESGVLNDCGSDVWIFALFSTFFFPNWVTMNKATVTRVLLPAGWEKWTAAHKAGHSAPSWWAARVRRCSSSPLHNDYA